MIRERLRSGAPRRNTKHAQLQSGRIKTTNLCKFRKTNHVENRFVETETSYEIVGQLRLAVTPQRAETRDTRQAPSRTSIAKIGDEKG